MKTKVILKCALFASCFALPLSAVMAEDAPAAPPPAVQIAPPAKGKAQIVLFRPSAMGMAIQCHLRENGKMLAKAGNGKYWAFSVDPGKHKYTVHSEVTNEINMEVDPDETTYVKCKITMGIMAGRPRLSPSTKAEFDAVSARLKSEDPVKMAKALAEDESKPAQ